MSREHQNEGMPEAGLLGPTPSLSSDEHQLASMGYKQELSRRMKGFSNFAISFSIICILSGGINSLGQGASAASGGPASASDGRSAA